MNKEKKKFKGGHEKMALWESIEKLNDIIRDVLSCIPETSFKERSQIINACDSISSNFVEGYYAGYINEYIRFLTYGRRSAAELCDRVKRVYERKEIGANLFEKFEERCYKTMFLIDRTMKGLRAFQNNKP
ncbi:MAG: four helix bundle protein [Parcubacteria group bacterium]